VCVCVHVFTHGLVLDSVLVKLRVSVSDHHFCSHFLCVVLIRVYVPVIFASETQQQELVNRDVTIYNFFHHSVSHI